MQQGHTTLPGGHFNFALVPGSHIADGLVIENFTDHAFTFHVYGADLLTASGGGLAPAQPDATMKTVGAWIYVATPDVTIPGHSEMTVAFTLTIPAKVAPGQQLGAVVTSATVGKTAQGSVIQARDALIVVVTVPGSPHPSASLGPLQASAPGPNQLDFRIELTNTGDLLLTYRGNVVVLTRTGREVAKLTLVPSDTYVVPGGHVSLTATLRASIPQTGAYSAQASVAIFTDGKPVGVLTSKVLVLAVAADAWIWIVVVATVLFCLVAVFLLVRGFRRRSHRRPLRASGKRHHGRPTAA